MNKTNAMRLLDKAGIPYTPIEYEIKEGDFSGEAVSALTGVPADETFKTLCVMGGKMGMGVFVIPVNKTLSLKKAAKALGEKSASMAKVENLVQLTGYPRGSVSPLGMKKRYTVFIDISARDKKTITISAGAKGYSLSLDPNKLISYLSADLLDLVENGQQ